MPEESNTESTTAQNTTSDGTDQNTGAETQLSGTGTQTAQHTEAQTQQQQQERTFTQAEVDRIVANRIKSGIKAELKKLTGEGENTPTIDDLQRQLSEQTQKIRSYEARAVVQEYLGDSRNKLNVKPENFRGIEELVVGRLEYGDDGKPSNLKDAIDAARSIAPALFVNAPQSIDAAQGRNNGGQVVGSDMSSFIRRQAGIGN